ncbi:hypothetical protein KHU50_000305 [Colletotrichum sp. SAR 10_65]|nr:hypothetical protein KHU50_000305 [Colletotrichum sp. SAR 10_65]
MVKLFNWLKEKNVENIIKVTVDDLQAIPHSDDAIEESLDGLVFGPIYDYVQPAVNQTSSQDSRPPKRSVDPHKWIQCMDRFAESFKNIKCVRDGVKDSSLSPVRVALIDDGTDITHSELNIQLPGKSFETCQEGPVSRVVPYWESASGHGTLMARLIRRVCPSAEILVIKLNVSTSEGSDKFQINVDSAIKAIEYAASRNVHIISMSWTTKQPTDTEKQRAFEAAMYTAISKKGILVFCAASDQGKAPDMTYPANANNDCFRIGAAEATGAVRATVGDTHRLSYIFPGHNVSMDSGDGTEKEVEGHSGSSVATALAAGLAALIIECVRLGIVYTNMSATPLKGDDDIDITTDDLTKIRQRNVMKQAFLGIGVSQNTNNKYIEVWDMFSQPAERLKRVNDSYGHLGIIAGLARLLLRKGGQNIAA